MAPGNLPDRSPPNPSIMQEVEMLPIMRDKDPPFLRGSHQMLIVGCCCEPKVAGGLDSVSERAEVGR